VQVHRWDVVCDVEAGKEPAMQFCMLRPF